jgi:AraC family transcriptional regulator
MGRPAISNEQYAFRLNHVLDYIDAQLDGDLSLETLAEQAHFSRFHFLRVFQDWYGEAPMAYVRRRRLEAGAALLRYGDHSVAGIALRCGFDTADGFTRSFRQYFGTTPVRWRQSGGPVAPAATAATPPATGPAGPVGLAGGPPPRPAAAQAWAVRVEQLPDTRVAYTRRVGAYGEASAAQWQQLADWMQQQRLSGLIRYGMGLDDPGVTPAAKCRYDVCVALPVSFEPPPRTPIKMVPGGLHAVLAYAGPPEGSAAAWVWLLKQWLPRSPHQLAPRAAFERYPAALPDPGGQAQDCELCLPLMWAGGL